MTANINERGTPVSFILSLAFFRVSLYLSIIRVTNQSLFTVCVYKGYSKMT